jgi:hypothetical protein
MNTTREEKIWNVSPSSEEGHFVKGAEKVIDLDAVTESFFVEGRSKLVTKNHTTLEMEEDCLVNCQVVYNPFAKMYEKSRD